MDLGEWLVAEHDDARHRLITQVLDVVPHERRRERFDNGNSIDWTLFHIARHASLALRIAEHDPAMSDVLLAGFDPALTGVDAGLQEEEQPWLALVDTPQLEAYALSVLDEVRAFLQRQDAAALDPAPDVADALQRVGLDAVRYGWLIRQWSEPHMLVRWVLLGHVMFHVGEATGVRNQLGLSPFRS